jgi:hypothetical protein
MSGRPKYCPPDPPRAAEVVKNRRCLKCGDAFASTSAGERVCPSWKATAAWRSGVPLRTGPSGFHR